MEELLGMFPPLALGDVRRDRRRCPANLAHQTENLFLGKSPGGQVALLRQLHRELPHFQLPVVLKRHDSLPPPATSHQPPLIEMVRRPPKMLGTFAFGRVVLDAGAQAGGGGSPLSGRGVR